MTDPIADYLTRIRNAQKAGHRVVNIPSSGIKREMTKILFDKGYIVNFKFESNIPGGIIKIALKYERDSKLGVIKNLTRVSRPGLRKYVGADDLPRVLNGLGIAVISTSKGVITDKEARKLNVGGEYICSIY